MLFMSLRELRLGAPMSKLVILFCKKFCLFKLMNSFPSYYLFVDECGAPSYSRLESSFSIVFHKIGLNFATCGRGNFEKVLIRLTALAGHHDRCLGEAVLVGEIERDPALPTTLSLLDETGLHPLSRHVEHFSVVLILTNQKVMNYLEVSFGIHMLPVDLRELEVIAKDNALAWEGLQILHNDKVVLADILYPKAEYSIDSCKDASIGISFEVRLILFRDIDNLVLLLLIDLLDNEALVMRHEYLLA